MPRVKQASKKKRTTKAAAVTALGAAGLGLSLVGSASASTAPTANILPSDNTSPDRRFVLGEEEMADVSLATFHLFDKENIGGGVQMARGGCGGCGHGLAVAAEAAAVAADAEAAVAAEDAAAGSAAAGSGSVAAGLGSGLVVASGVQAAWVAQGAACPGEPAACADRHRAADLRLERRCCGRLFPDRFRSRHIEGMIDQARRALDEANRRRQRGVHVERRIIAPARVEEEQPLITDRPIDLDEEAAGLAPRTRRGCGELGRECGLVALDGVKPREDREFV